MEHVSAFVSELKPAEFVSLIAALVTAVATVALFVVTWVLAKETRVLSMAASMPNVTAILEPNRWALMYFDLVVMNSGNAPAYEIFISIDPPFKGREGFLAHQDDVPLRHISIMQPGQTFRSSICKYNEIEGKKLSVRVTWKKRPGIQVVDSLLYDIDIADFKGLGFVGEREPIVQIAKEVKALRDDWRGVARGSTKIEVDAYTQRDRDRNAARWRTMRDDAKSEADADMTEDGNLPDHSS